MSGPFLKCLWLQYNTGMTLHSTSFTIWSTLFRLFLACVSAGVIGYGRTRRGRTAGFRTYMLTGIGAAMSIMLAIYMYQMLKGPWHATVETVGMKFDASRYAAQVLSGIGFLAAGSIIAIEHQQVEGLTTATGLFASVCMGLTAGAGFYECVILALILILITLNLMAPLEIRFKRRHRNITIFIEFDSIDDIDKITSLIKERDGTIYDIDVQQMEKEKDKYPSAVFYLKLGRDRPSHSEILSSIAELPCVYGVEELIS